MPSFADIKSHALKAKDSAADKFSSTKVRYQVSSSSPPRARRSLLTSDTRRRAPLPRSLIYRIQSQTFPRHLCVRNRALQDRNLIRTVLLPKLYEADVLIHPPVHHLYHLYLLHLRNLRLQDLLNYQGDDSIPLQNQLQTLNQTRTRSIGRISPMRISECSLAGWTSFSSSLRETIRSFRTTRNRSPPLRASGMCLQV